MSDAIATGGYTCGASSIATDGYVCGQNLSYGVSVLSLITFGGAKSIVNIANSVSSSIKAITGKTSIVISDNQLHSSIRNGSTVNSNIDSVKGRISGIKESYYFGSDIDD